MHCSHPSYRGSFEYVDSQTDAVALFQCDAGLFPETPKTCRMEYRIFFRCISGLKVLPERSAENVLPGNGTHGNQSLGSCPLILRCFLTDCIRQHLSEFFVALYRCPIIFGSSGSIKSNVFPAHIADQIPCQSVVDGLYLFLFMIGLFSIVIFTFLFFCSAFALSVVRFCCAAVIFTNFPLPRPLSVCKVPVRNVVPFSKVDQLVSFP